MITLTSPWLKELRSHAWDAYRAAPEPGRVAHLWRYTDPALFALPESALDGAPRPDLIRAEPAPAGVTVLEHHPVGPGTSNQWAVRLRVP